MKTWKILVLVLVPLTILAATLGFVLWRLEGDNISPKLIPSPAGKGHKTVVDLDASKNTRFWTQRLIKVGSQEDDLFHDKLHQPSSPVVPSETEHVVLFWNSLFLDAHWGLPADTVRLKCELATCIFTKNHDHLPAVTDYAAIVFHMAGAFKAPTHRNSSQFYVFALLNSPQNTEAALLDGSPAFNLTMTYRLDADIVWTYNHILLKADNRIVAPSKNVRWLTMDNEWVKHDKHLLQRVKNKKKMIAWFPDKCDSDSNREDLVKSLQEHVKLDVYGVCGNTSCSEPLSPECIEMLNKDYKFYLSFENALCQDYVSDKLYTALNLDVIPVVFGGANYSNFAPPHSYIDVQMYANVQELATYLLYLKSDYKAYSRYFWWKRFYKLADETNKLSLPYCDLCRHLNLPDTQDSSDKYQDIKSYWYDDMCTETARIKFKNNNL